MKRVILDAESIGLHGECFAIGYVVKDELGKEVESGMASCPIETAKGDLDDCEWVSANVSLGEPTHANPRAVRDWWWEIYRRLSAEGAGFWCDCLWPVEANLFSACIADDPVARKWLGPYPLGEITEYLRMAGRNPLEYYPRLDDELPAHNPRNDSRQSARIFFECLDELNAKN